MQSYNHREVEKKWQERWEKERVFEVSEEPNKQEQKRYVLDMFPYPSSDGLHVGHPEGYTATDIYARYLRMNGYHVLHPMGWDAFGLPAENYAIKQGVHPAKTTAKNIATFKRQIKSLGFSYDWSREINTSSPDYYRWTQWLFLQLYKHGLAYKKKAPVNWCDHCKTVLANEQVANGACERCKHSVVQKELEQWFFKVTQYAEELLSALDTLNWPEPIKLAQKNWIGRSEGAEIDFPILATDGAKPNFLILHGYTGRADKNFIPWLAKELHEQGFSVQAPQMPNTDYPKESEQVSYVLHNCAINEQTVLVGHSLGGAVAMKILEKLDHPVAGLVLVAPAVEPRFRTGDPRPFWDTFTFEYDYITIQKKAKFRIILSDILEKEHRGEYLSYLSEQIAAPIRESEAQKIHFRDKKEPFILSHLRPKITVFTTRPDTLFGATYMVLAPEHSLIDELKESITNWKEIEKYRSDAAGKNELERTHLEKEKTGVPLEGITAINPANGEEIPMWIADYVLASYGTGAIMAVPAHDERDFEFAKKYDLPIRMVICPHYPKPTCPVLEEAYEGDGHLVESGEFNGLPAEEAKWKIAEKIGGERVTQYRIRDWLISRQRYWGAPIPIIYCDTCGTIPVPAADLPVLLPTDVDFKPTGESPLQRSKSFHTISCPTCGKPARRESDTMDTFVCSSWYYLRYPNATETAEPFTKESLAYWLPVDMYVGGAEHAVLHLLYARFVTKALRDMKLLSFDEPFLRLKNQGMILGEDGEKMSKSRGNVINPDEIVERYGADTLRVYEMFMGPFEQTKPWSAGSIIGVRRFLEKCWKLYERLEVRGVRLEVEKPTLEKLLHKTIKKVTDDIVTFNFNTAISALMILLNTLQKGPLSEHTRDTFLLLLAPFAPHIAEELWEKMGHRELIAHAPWPSYDSNRIKDDVVRLTIQINGKVRDFLDVAAGTGEDALKSLALTREAVKKWTDGKEIKKVVIIPDRLVNIVVE